MVDLRREVEELKEKVNSLETALEKLKAEVDRRLAPLEEVSLKLIEEKVKAGEKKERVEKIDWQGFFRKLRKSRKGEWAPVEDLKGTGIVEELRRRNGCITTRRLKIYLLQGSKGEYVRVVRRGQ